MDSPVIKFEEQESNFINERQLSLRIKLVLYDFRSIFHDSLMSPHWPFEGGVSGVVILMVLVLLLSFCRRVLLVLFMIAWRPSFEKVMSSWLFPYTEVIIWDNDDLLAFPVTVEIV